MADVTANRTVVASRNSQVETAIQAYAAVVVGVVGAAAGASIDLDLQAWQ